MWVTMNLRLPPPFLHRSPRPWRARWEAQPFDLIPAGRQPVPERRDRARLRPRPQQRNREVPHQPGQARRLLAKQVRRMAMLPLLQKRVLVRRTVPTAIPLLRIPAFSRRWPRVACPPARFALRLS